MTEKSPEQPPRPRPSRAARPIAVEGDQASTAAKASGPLEKAARAAARRAVKAGKRRVTVVTTIKVGKLKAAAPPTVTQGGMLLLDAGTIELTQWANRHESSYLTADFLELKRSILHHGGNEVPVLVRPCGAEVGADEDAQTRYQLVYGHRRLQACRELKLPVRAVVEAVSDTELVRRMHAENRDRANVSAFEEGTFYKRLLDNGMFPSLRKLSAAFGVDAGDVSRKISVASLPPEVLQAIQSPLDISCDDAKRLQPAWNRDQDAVKTNARTIRDTCGPLPAKQAVARLIEPIEAVGGVGASNALPALDPALHAAHIQPLVQLQSSDGSGVAIRINRAMSSVEVGRLHAVLEQFVSRNPS